MFVGNKLKNTCKEKKVNETNAIHNKLVYTSDKMRT